jgi:hypothetical protein
VEGGEGVSESELRDEGGVGAEGGDGEERVLGLGAVFAPYPWCGRRPFPHWDFAPENKIRTVARAKFVLIQLGPRQ